MSNQKPEVDSEARRGFLEFSLLGLAGGSLAAWPLGSGQADAQESAAGNLQALFPAGAPAAASGYSPGIRARGSRVVVVSGQGPENYQTDMETQIRQTFERIGRVLKAGGASFEHVVMMRSYFVHLLRDLPAYRKVRTDFLVEPYPASTAVGVTELAIPGLEVEIEALAIV